MDNRRTSSPSTRRTRLIPRGDDDRFEVVRTGHRKQRLGDMYVRLLAASWKRLLLLVVLLYFGVNVFFALAYMGLGDGITKTRPARFVRRCVFLPAYRRWRPSAMEK